jgi:hypothetical protein
MKEVYLPAHQEKVDEVVPDCELQAALLAECKPKDREQIEENRRYL